MKPNYEEILQNKGVIFRVTVLKRFKNYKAFWIKAILVAHKDTLSP